MTKINKLSIGIIIGLAVLIGVLLGINYIGNALGANPVANTSGVPVNLIGTQVGTTTTPVAFYGSNTVASTTYPFRIGQDTDKVAITLLFPEASSTGSTVNLSILSSNDPYCDTATTSTIYNVTTVNQIKWYDASRNILNLAGATTGFSGATTTLILNPIAGSGKQIVLTDLNTQCLALEVSASSTKLMSQFVTK